MKMKNEVRLIDANALVRDHGEDVTNWDRPYAVKISSIEAAPAIDPESLRPKGRWERTGEADYKCSVCGFRFTSGDPIEMFPYCRCGCKMEG